jgi:hypothetical protein
MKGNISTNLALRAIHPIKQGRLPYLPEQEPLEARMDLRGLVVTSKGGVATARDEEPGRRASVEGGECGGVPRRGEAAGPWSLVAGARVAGAGRRRSGGCRRRRGKFGMRRRRGGGGRIREEKGKAGRKRKA